MSDRYLRESASSWSSRLLDSMTGAIATAGVRVGGPFHLGVAPTLLLTMLFLLCNGAGSAALDARVAARLGR
ncbi:hypothetical protein [Nocardia sp. NPDC005366]|uniref:hypothetical protein n=1 Tax=Nocardia sp. NPDC005366 TaxID=3156878 RepID=UPI0033A1FCA8